MILQPSNVELTKVHYYGKNGNDRNLRISTISREVYENSYNRNVIIKRNIFGQRWVLRINERDDLKKTHKYRIALYVLVFCSILLAVASGIFFSLDKLIFKEDSKTSNKYKLQEAVSDTHTTNKTREDRLLNATRNENPATVYEMEKKTYSPPFCNDCISGVEVCLKVEETGKPRCVLAADWNDPTGCGGLCSINTHFCQILDARLKVFQCSLLTDTLKCPKGAFSCGNMCISQEKRCDGVMDCSDLLDEKNCDCNLKTHFQCGNSTSCLDLTKKCDKRIDCWDKSDEMECSTVTCLSNEHPCQNNQCLAKEKFCDGTPDCSDESDEPEGCRR
ncbi:uncharacterized protein isoform X2 [Leptinotarsa decemlineata]|uniref:uncharacterized protein isoform X2 n=1 Tax=Leptinotarsa decemlineata TaxID=7539 RepID=UPI003D3059E2